VRGGGGREDYLRPRTFNQAAGQHRKVQRMHPVDSRVWEHRFTLCAGPVRRPLAVVSATFDWSQRRLHLHGADPVAPSQGEVLRARPLPSSRLQRKRIHNQRATRIPTLEADEAN